MATAAGRLGFTQDRLMVYLDLKPLCIDVDETGQLRDADNPVAGKISDVNSTNNWSKVMLAVGFE
jgi:hypothetical protein